MLTGSPRSLHDYHYRLIYPTSPRLLAATTVQVDSQISRTTVEMYGTLDIRIRPVLAATLTLTGIVCMIMNLVALAVWTANAEIRSDLVLRMTTNSILHVNLDSAESQRLIVQVLLVRQRSHTQKGPTLSRDIPIVLL
jgi:hypothetical protein